jgi:membrane protease YdiL (CAAX protease family)
MSPPVDDPNPAPAPVEPSAPVEPLPSSPPARPPLGAGWALLCFLVFWLVQLAVVAGAMFVATVILISKGAHADRVLPRLMEPDLLLGATLTATAVAVVVLLAMLRHRLRDVSPERPLAPVGVVGAPRRAVLAAAGQAVLVLVAFVVVSRYLPRPQHELGPLARAAMAGGWSRVAWAVLAVFVAPPSEELVFRGVLYTGLARSWGVVAAAVVTTLAFTAFHFTEIRDYWPAWIQIAVVAALALRARVRSGSLIPGTALHATYNAGLVLLTYLAGGTK